MKWSAVEVAEVPPGVVTVTSSVPAVPVGSVAVIWVLEFTTKPGAGVVAKSTALAPVRLVPVMTTLVPPVTGPVEGLRAVTVGAGTGLTKMNLSALDAAEVIPDVVTVTSTDPADSAGEVAVTWVAEFTVKLVAAVVPNFTALAPVKLVPVMVTLVPPDVGPEEGLTAVTVGAAT